MMTQYNTFIFGMIGALAPEIVRLYDLRNDPSRFHWSWFYVIISLILAGLAGLVAFILPTTNSHDAFYAGIATPLIITTAAKKLQPKRRKKALKAVNQQATRMSPFDSFLDAL